MTSPLQQVIQCLNMKSECELKEFIRSKLNGNQKRVKFVHNGFQFQYDENGFYCSPDYRYMVTTSNFMNIIF